jgi:hypothetical protein
MTSLDIFQESVDSMTDISPFAIAKGVVKVDKDLFNSEKIKSMIDFVTDAGNVVFKELLKIIKDLFMLELMVGVNLKRALMQLKIKLKI